MTTKDPYIERLVDRAVPPYRTRLRAEALEEIRELLGDALATHPIVSQLIERGRPHENVLRSDEHERGASADGNAPDTGAGAPGGEVVPFDRGRRPG
jgi:hypothetical protein